MNRCYACAQEVQIKPPVGRKDLCPACGRELRCCRNCNFYAAEVYNACREPQAERVLEKERSNFCDFFRFREGGAPATEGDRPPAKDRLAALFK